MSDQSASIRLSTEHTGRRRREPVWIGRYRVVCKDSANVLAKASVKRSRAPDIAARRKYIHDAPQPEAAAKIGALVGEQLGDVAKLRRVG